MRRISVIVLMAVAFLAGSLTLTSAEASHDSTTIRLVSVTDQFKELDLGDKGPSLGDMFVFHDNLFVHKRRVGDLNGQCAVTTVRGTGDNATGAQQCLVTASLPSGDITVQGVIRFGPNESDHAVLAVTGGTGRYSGAGGEVHVRFVSDTKTLIEVDLN